jgi:hypothetical protein
MGSANEHKRLTDVEGLCKTVVAIMCPSATHPQSIDYGVGNKRIYNFPFAPKSGIDFPVLSI